MASTRSAPTKRMAMSLRLQPPPLPDTCIEHRRPWGQTSLCILAHSRPSVAAFLRKRPGQHRSAVREGRLLAGATLPSWVCSAHECPTPVLSPKGEGGYLAGGPRQRRGTKTGLGGLPG